VIAFLVLWISHARGVRHAGERLRQHRFYARVTTLAFAALSLVLGRVRPFFSRTAPDAPALFDGMRVEAYVARNKLGGSGHAAVWRALVDTKFPPSKFSAPAFSVPPSHASTSPAMPIAASS